MALLEFCPEGIFCPLGNFWIDPWRKVPFAIITHAHADHARPGMGRYLSHFISLPVMRKRLGENISIQGIQYGEIMRIGRVNVSLHPAGHIPGSAQVCVEYKGEKWVVSGDYKLEDDGISTPFEPVKCQTFITESTFGLPVYNWPSQKLVFDEIEAWWRSTRELGKIAVLTGYSLGKAQRILHHLQTDGFPVYCHGAISTMNEALQDAGFSLPDIPRYTADIEKKALKNALILAPPSVIGSTWLKHFQPCETAVCSGWMTVRGARRRRNADRGFVLSDHADWRGLNEAISATGAENIFVTHGYSEIFSQWLREKGFNAAPIQTEFEGELSEIGESSTDNENHG